MSKKIIITGKERIIKRYLSFTLSFFITGLGEAYSGSVQRGILLALIRPASLLVVPFYSFNYIKSSYLTEIAASLIFFASVTLLSPFNALSVTPRDRKIIVTRFNSLKFMILFSVLSILITTASASVFFSFFSIIKLDESNPPIFDEGDIIAVRKISSHNMAGGEVAALNHNKSCLLRITGLSGEKVSYKKGRFSLQDSELFQSVFSDDEINILGISGYGIISETNGGRTYPVFGADDLYRFDIYLKKDELFAAPDDRSRMPDFLKIRNSNIYGRVEGIIFSKTKKRFMIKPFLPGGGTPPSN